MPSLSTSLSPRDRTIVLIVAFLGWMFAGTQMSITPLVSRPATIDFLWSDAPSGKFTDAQEQTIGGWFAANNAAFLLGAATGGVVFGWLGDRFGRTRAVGWSILVYSAVSALAGFVRTPQEFVLLRFLACLGVGGMWPNGIALVSEAWPSVSRPTLAGVIGTSANVGLVLVALITLQKGWGVTTENWRLLMFASAIPLPLGLYALLAMPESPRWLDQRQAAPVAGESIPLREIFTPPLLSFTVVGILLSTVPLFGGWGSGNWLVPWTGQVWDATDPGMKSWTQLARSLGGTIGSLLGGWIAAGLGRRLSYFLMSLACLLLSEYLYFSLTPRDDTFLAFVALIGFTGGFFFGWMPLCFPEMFPTRVRSTGTGVAFNFGRILSALGVAWAGILIKSERFSGDYARVGQITSLIYIAGMLVILLSPTTRQNHLDPE